MGGVSQNFFETHSNPQFDSVRTIDITHCLDHRGKSYITGHNDLTVADNAFTSVLLIVNGRKEVAVIWSIEAEGKAIADVYMDPVVTNTGDALTVFNLNKYESAPVSVVEARADVTTSDNGTPAMPQELILGGIGPKTAGAGHETEREIIIPPGHSMLITVQNISGQSKSIDLEVTWTEVDEFNITTTTSTTTTTTTTTA